MGLLDRAFRSTEVTLNLKDPELVRLFGGHESVSGAHITPENSLRIGAWYAGVQILAGTIASLPCMTYRRLPKGRERAVNHPVYKLLHDQPNPFMSSFEFFETSQGHLLGRGNSFALKEINGAGEVTALWPLAPSRIRLQIIKNRIWYFHYGSAYDPSDGSGEQAIPMENMVHVRGLSSDGILGYSPVDLAREQLGLTKAEEEYRARFFRNDARPGAIIEYPDRMSDEAYERFKKDWQETYAGLGNKFKMGFLEQGLKLHEVGLTAEASQFIEGRKFQIEEIARILRIPLVLLQSTEKATSWGTGIEQFMLGFLQFTIREWLTRWQRRMNIALFTEQERRSLYTEFLVDDLLRADSKTRAEVLQIWRQNGVINANDWLEMENRNPLPGEVGKFYIIPANMTNLGSGATISPQLMPPGPLSEPVPEAAGYSNGHARE